MAETQATKGPAMVLTRREVSILSRLAKWKPGQLCELDTSKDGGRLLNECRALAARGLVSVLREGRCLFEIVRGDFVCITEAGRAVLSASTTDGAQ